MNSSVITVVQSLVKIVTLIVSVGIYLCSLAVPRNDQIWLFTAGSGDRFAENSKYLFLYCGRCEDVRNVWITTDESVNDELTAAGYESHLATSLTGRLIALRAGVAFRTHEPVLPTYTGGATPIQLSHGNYLKKMGYDNGNSRYDSKLAAIAGEYLLNRRTKYVVTSLDWPAELVESAFKISRSRMLSTGFPRNDVLLRDVPDATMGIDLEMFELITDCNRDQTLLFYTPTWRAAYGEENGVSLSEIDLGLSDVDQVLEEYDAHLFIAPHPESTFDRDTDSLNNVSILETGGDIYPFLKYCDVLVTDYSGIFYDYLLLDRPIIFYAPDLQEYNQSRGLYFDYDNHVPGPVAQSPTAFKNQIRRTLQGEDEHADARREVRSAVFEDGDGNASERVYRRIIRGRE